MHVSSERSGWQQHHGRLVASLLGAGVALLLAGVGWHLLMTLAPTQEQVELETAQQRLDLQQHQVQAARDAAAAKADQGWDPSRTATWVRIAEISVLGTLALGIPAVLVALGLRAWHRRDLPEADGRVRLPGLTAEQRLYAHAGFLRVAQTRDPAVLTRIYGAGPVAGRAPEPSPDGSRT